MNNISSLLHSPTFWLVLVAGVLTAWALVSYLVVRGIEEPRYTVVEETDEYEIRRYEPYIVAETTVAGPYDEALREGFSRIANYIFGNNTATEKIAMTTPVLEETNTMGGSEKIAMTTPVLDTGTDASRTVAFVLPAEYSLDTLPQPNDERVTLRAVPAQTVAVHTYTWYTSGARIDQKLETLRSHLEQDGYDIRGTGQSAQYNPPLSMPLMLRNEVWFTITQ